ncbi:MAG TPA: type II secretion system F family protein [Verrucomicrobiae bacterium]
MYLFINSLLASLLFCLLMMVVCAFCSLVLYVAVTQPLRRRDRARFFIDFLETLIDQGSSLEQGILTAAEQRDRVMGVKFFMVAAHIENGCRLSEALQRVSGFLPPSVNAMLAAGEKLGDLRKVFPAAREVLRAAPDHARSNLHYVMGVVTVFALFAVMNISLLITFVVPKFKDVFAGMGIPYWPVTAWVLRHASQMVVFEILIALLMLFLAAVYVGGPRFIKWFQFVSFPLVDWLACHVPWKHKKLVRTFSAMLAVLLDGGVPEPEAVRLAGEATSNEICRRRARRVCVALQSGTNLATAVKVFDPPGELPWRIQNAGQSRRGFLATLAGWHESLDIKALYQENLATHLFTSALILLNGVIVGLLAIGMFGMLILLLKHTIDNT